MGRYVEVTFRPLTQWPAARARTPDGERENARFKSPGYVENSGTPSHRYVGPRKITLSRTLNDLNAELRHIDAQGVVVQVDLENDRNFRQDGGIRADARVRSPAVVLTFQRGRVPYVFATDHFKTWEDNLRAIVLGLESLRRLERYHIAQAGDQYRGWTALPASTTPALTTLQAATVVARRARPEETDGQTKARAEVIVGNVTAAKAQVRLASANTHPDAGGATTDFQLVQEAKRVLESHFGVGL